MVRGIVLVLLVFPFLAFGQSPKFENHLSFYWGQTFRIGDNNYHSFEISNEIYTRTCLNASFRGFGIRYDYFKNDNFSVSLKYFRSLVRRPSLLYTPYWSISPVFFQFDKFTGFNLKPEIGLRFNTSAFTRLQPISLSLNVSYGYDIPITNETKFNVSRHDFAAKIAISIDLREIRYKLKRQKEEEQKDKTIELEKKL